MKKIIISRLHNMAAVLQHSQVEELIIVHNTYQVGDIYLGIISKIFKGINAAFVNLDIQGKSGFLHVNDSIPLKKRYHTTSINKILTTNQRVLVQVTREPTSRKGPRLTANVTLSGRYLILMPFSKTACISRKIANQEKRSYLKALAILIKPFNMGLLFRQYAVDVGEDVILQELNALKKQWNFIEKSATSSICPSLLYKDDDIIKRVLRDFYNLSVTDIIVDSPQTLLQLQEYFKNNNYFFKSEKTDLNLSSRKSYFLESSYIIPTILNALKTKIRLPLGGHICIETYEALTIIDVNSGSFNNSPSSRETILRTNCSAATEIAYQLRVRNITGVILIDFIDMRRQRDQMRLLKHFTQVLGLDNAKPQIVQLSELGLIELTRRRRSKGIAESYDLQLIPKQRKSTIVGCIEFGYVNLIFYPFESKYANLRYFSNSTISNSYTNSVFFKRIFLSICFSIFTIRNIQYFPIDLKSLLKEEDSLISNNDIYISKLKTHFVSLYFYQKVIHTFCKL